MLWHLASVLLSGYLTNAFSFEKKGQITVVNLGKGSKIHKHWKLYISFHNIASVPFFLSCASFYHFPLLHWSSSRLNHIIPENNDLSLHFCGIITSWNTLKTVCVFVCVHMHAHMHVYRYIGDENYIMNENEIFIKIGKKYIVLTLFLI